MAVGAGDRLARGAAKAQFPPAGGNVSAEKWNDIFADFDPEKYLRDTESKKNENEENENNS